MVGGLVWKKKCKKAEKIIQKKNIPGKDQKDMRYGSWAAGC